MMPGPMTSTERIQRDPLIPAQNVRRKQHHLAKEKAPRDAQQRDHPREVGQNAIEFIIFGRTWSI